MKTLIISLALPGLLAMAVILLAGCGVISRMMPSSRALDLTSSPSGVRVTLEGGKSGTTPCKLRVPEGDITLMTAFKHGYRSRFLLTGNACWPPKDTSCRGLASRSR